MADIGHIRGQPTDKSPPQTTVSQLAKVMVESRMMRRGWVLSWGVRLAGLREKRIDLAVCGWHAATGSGLKCNKYVSISIWARRKTKAPSSQRRVRRGIRVPWDTPDEPESHAGLSVAAELGPSPSFVTLHQACVQTGTICLIRLCNGLGPSLRWDDTYFLINRF